MSSGEYAKPVACIRCRAEACTLLAFLGITTADALVERWQCLHCKKTFLLEYHTDGDICWCDFEYPWPKGRT